MAGCGARTGLNGLETLEDYPAQGAGGGSTMDGKAIAPRGGTGNASLGGPASGGTSQPRTTWPDPGSETADPNLCPTDKYVETGCSTEQLEGAVGLCNDLDDDCDGSVDEGCPCLPGAVKTCFDGPPRRRHVGACQDGLQACEATADPIGRWGPCLGGISPSTEVCDNLDNDCDGCRDEISGCVPFGSCPGPGDHRIVELRPFQTFQLRADEFYGGDARSYSWTIEGGPCDRVAPTGIQSFQLTGTSSRVATFVPKLSGDYAVTLSVQALSGETFRCNWVIPVRGPGLRIEMCYPESATQDLDLYLKRTSSKTAWFTGNSAFTPNSDECAWHNCEAELRGSDLRPSMPSLPRADWGYAASPVSVCSGGPQGAQWVKLGYCANPRLDIDNNQEQGTGLPENINIDQPRNGDGFRVMVQNFSGTLAHPIVNVYCGGVRYATYGAPPDALSGFSGSANGASAGAMWRVADVTTRVSPTGQVTCTISALHPAGSNAGYHVTRDDPSY